MGDLPMSWHEDFSETDYQQYWNLSPEARGQRLTDQQTADALKALLLYQQGRQALDTHDVNTAIASFAEALTLRPGWHDVWAGHAAALLKAGEQETAIVSCDRALELEPSSAEAWSVKGAALYRLGRHEAAANSCDRALELNPDDHQAWSTLSDALNRQGRYEEAVVSYDKALALKPDEPFTWGNRGAALQKLGRYEEAISSYDKLLQAEPKRYRLWHQRGLALRKLRRFDAAIANFDEALSLQPDFYPATRSKLFMLLQTGQLWRYVTGSKTPTEREKVTRDLRNVCDSVVKTKLPTLVVISLVVLSSTHSQVMALAIAGVFLLIAAIGDLLAESQQ
ncbi:MAG: tetratricopeptide repeat protein [Tildeniella nuda ZEHNDER 1965/U140]|jgi:tetratricopeptide (TPR) repeat protein|nr:tetratricopeptide repeat protein [Tildeniella nuda ZEHNDER 1965/U140]